MITATIPSRTFRVRTHESNVAEILRCPSFDIRCLLNETHFAVRPPLRILTLSRNRTFDKESR